MTGIEKAVMLNSDSIINVCKRLERLEMALPISVALLTVAICVICVALTIII